MIGNRIKLNQCLSKNSITSIREYYIKCEYVLNVYHHLSNDGEKFILLSFDYNTRTNILRVLGYYDEIFVETNLTKTDIRKKKLISL
jgi:hypothetical protein